MTAPRGDSERTKAEIIGAARHLFAERGIADVSVRDIAREAGVTHGLVHHYFGTKEHLLVEVIKAAQLGGAGVLAANPLEPSPDALDVMRRMVRYFLTDGRVPALLVARAELAGLEPEKLIQPGTVGPLEFMTKAFAGMQRHLEPDGPRFDPALVSMCVAACVIGLDIMHPWLMTVVGLDPVDFDARLDDISDVIACFAAVAIGLSPVGN